jgi:hypothetical protein
MSPMTTPKSTDRATPAQRRGRAIRLTVLCLFVVVLTLLAASLGLSGR